ncbi:MAG: hypothetical protein AAF715_10425 [Myxococcota bacterium]
MARTSALLTRRPGVRRAFLAVAWLLWLGGSSVVARAANVCIRPEPNPCSGPRVALGPHQPLAFGVPRPLPVAPPPRLAPLTTSDAGIPSPSRRARPSQRWLMAEIAEVEALLAATRRDHPDHPRILRRLAERYVELADGLSSQGASTPARARRARRAAIRFYRRLHRSHPDYCRFPRAPRARRSCDDEVLYLWGLELERIGEATLAARRYRTLLMTSGARSPHAPAASLAAAEIAFDDARADATRWPAAARAYVAAIAHAPPGGTSWAYAHYKLGHVRWHQNDHRGALKAFFDALRASPTKALREALRRDLIPVYARVGDPARAWVTFDALVGSGPAEPDATRRMVEALARRLLDTAQFEDAETVYAALSLHPASAAARCRDQAARVDIARARWPREKPRVEAALRTLVRRFEAIPEDRTCGALTASRLASTAIAWHVEAMGNPGGAPPRLGTGDAATAEAAARLYRRFTRTFTDGAALARYPYPQLRPEDRPTLSRIHYAHADLLWSLADWRGCAPAFEAARRAAPEGPLAARAIQGRALCHLRQSRSARGPRSLEVQTQTALGPAAARAVDAYGRYLCRIEAVGAAGRTRRDRIIAARATLLAAHGHYEAAARDERALAFHSGPAAPTAAGRYLDAVEALRRREAKASCVAEMRRALPRLRQRHCDGSSPPRLCAALSDLEGRLDRREADALLRHADAGRPGARHAYRTGAQSYLEHWRRRGRDACLRGDASCPTFARILHEAARAFTRAGLRAAAIDVRSQLVDPAHHLHRTAVGIDARRDLGVDFEALGDEAEAATHFRRYALDHPAREDAPVALAHAITLRRRAGGDPSVLVAAFHRRFAHRAPRLAMEVSLERADTLALRGDTARARRHLIRDANRFRAVSLQLMVRIEARLGRWSPSAGDGDAHFARAQTALLQRPALLRSLHVAARGDGPRFARRGERRVASTMAALGEAVFRRAASLHARATQWPRGPDARRWLATRADLVEAAVDAYAPLLELDAPDWSLRAALATAQLHEGLARDAQGIVDDVDRYRRRARQAFEACVELGIVHQRFDGPARRCRDGLAQAEGEARRR